MAHASPNDSEAQTEHPRRRERPRAAWWWLAAGTFVVGLVAGGLVVGFAGWGSSSSSVVPSSSAPVSTVAPTPSTTSSGLTGTLTVNTACIAAINDAQQAFNAIGQLVSALRSLDAAQIDRIVRQLQPLQTRLQSDLHACDVVTELPNGVLTTASAGPSGSIAVPSTSPTS